MSTSYTVTSTSSFTMSHARHISAKVATDLKRVQRFYGKPSDLEIEDYEEEVAILIKYGYLESVSYGFKRNGNWIEPSLHYKARDFSGTNNDDPGRIRPGANIAGASFYSFLTYTQAFYDELPSQSDKNAFKAKLPFPRSSGARPGVDGYLCHDRTYAAGGRSMERATVRGF